MADFIDFLDPVTRQSFERAALGRQAQYNPEGTGMTPEEETSWLSRQLDASLGGLSYLGKLADKTFGARAARAGLNMLTGAETDPAELLSFLPLSDTLGLTRESNVVQGTDLLANAGLLTRGDDSWENQLAGFGAEVLFDPSTYLGIGPLTKAGQALSKSGGKLAPKLSGRIAAGEASLLDVGLPFQKAIFGADRIPIGTGAAGEWLARRPAEWIGKPVSALARGAEAYPGEWAKKVIGVNPVTAVGELGDAVYRQGRRLFDTRAAEAATRFGQKLAEEKFVPELKAGQAAAEARWAESLTGLDDFAKKVPVDKRYDFNAALVQNAEGYRSDAEGRLASLGFQPDEITQILAVGDRVATQTRATIGAERAVGLLSKEATDVPEWAKQANIEAQAAGLPGPFPTSAFPTDYFPRTALNPEKGLGFPLPQNLSGIGQFQDARTEIFRGIPGGTLGIEKLVRDPALSGFQRTTGPLGVQDELLKTITGHGMGPTPAAWQGTPWGDAAWEGAQKQAKQLADYLEQIPEKVQKEGLFNLEFTGLAKARQMDSARVLASGNTVMAGLTQQAQPLAVLRKAGIPAVPVEEALAKAGLTHADPGEPGVAAQNLAAALGVSVNDLRNMAVPEEVAKDMFRIGQMWRTPEAVQPVIEMTDRVQNLFKSGVTSPFPAFHVRNLLTGITNMARADVLSWQAAKDMFNVLRGGTLSESSAAKLFPNMPLDEATKKFRELLIGNNVAFTRAGQVGETIGGVEPLSRTGLVPGELPDVGGQVRPLGQDVRQFLGGYIPEKGKLMQQANPLESLARETGTGPRSYFTPMRQGEKLGNTTEDWIRGTHFLGALLKGDNPAAAKLSTMKYQIDYGELTQFEKNVMRRVFPFYTFTRRNLPPILEDLATNPGKITSMVRLSAGVRDPGQFAPAFIGEGASMPIPGAPEGEQRYISGFGLPIEDEGLKSIGSILRGDTRRVLQMGLGMANPLVKFPFEQAFGTQLFSGRKLEELKPSPTVSLGGLIPDQTARAMTEVVANSPLSRAVGTVDRLMDPRKSIGATLVNLGTGVKLADVETDKQTDIAARRLLQDALTGTPGIRTRTEVYAPAAARPDLDPNQRLMLELMKSFDKRIQDRAAQDRLLHAR